MVIDDFSITRLALGLLLFITAFVGLVLLMKLGDRLAFWVKTRNALPFIPTEEYEVGQVLRHYNVYLEVTASLGSCTDCYFNTGKNCTVRDKCADYTRDKNRDYVIYKRIYK